MNKEIIIILIFIIIIIIIIATISMNNNNYNNFNKNSNSYPNSHSNSHPHSKKPAEKNSCYVSNWGVNSVGYQINSPFPSIEDYSYQSYNYGLFNTDAPSIPWNFGVTGQTDY